MIRAVTRRFHRRRYSGALPPRLWRAASACAVLTLGLACGGCSISYQLDSFLGGDKSDVTGSIAPSLATQQAARMPPADDLVYARAAAAEALRRNEKYVSLPWENPNSGARGTVTPIATSYTQDGRTCRDFLASYVAGSAESWLQGEACKATRGVWEVRSIKPWKNS